MIGTTLSNRYKLTRLLGSGGMAWVYLAEDLVKAEIVAVKVLYPQYSQDVGFLQRFAREASLSMTLSRDTEQHNVVRVLDYGADRDTYYLVMEFVPGKDLGQILSQAGPLDWRRSLEIARQVAQALELASSHEIVHRDIKPSNIMIRPDGTAQVLDFGIAKARTLPHLTVSGFVGSPNYAAPEQAIGRAVDLRADIYSLGVVLYEMLTGDLPFQGDTPWSIVNQHVTAPPPALEVIRPDLPLPITQLVRKAMEKEPEERFQSAAEFIEALEAALAGNQHSSEQAPDVREPEHSHSGKTDALSLGAPQAERIEQPSDKSATRIDTDGMPRSDPGSGLRQRLVETWGTAWRERRPLWLAASLAVVILILAIYVAVLATNRPVRVPASDATLPSTQTSLPTHVSQATEPVPTPIPTQAASTSTATLGPSPLPASPSRAPTATRSPTVTSSPMTDDDTATAVLAEASSTPTETSTSTPTAMSSPRNTISGQIAFPRFDPARGTYDVHICSVDGSLCRMVIGQASQPDFLPDGTQLVVHSWKSDEKGLILSSLSTQRIWRITDQIEAARPSVDFRGDAYVFHSRQESDRRPRLFRTYAAEVRPINRESGMVLGQSPSWLPDQRILYSGCWLDACGILVMEGDGTSPHQIVAGSAEANPEASPDGHQIAFMSFRNGNWEVYSVNRDGGNLRRLTNSSANDGLPTWSPDGRSLAFVTDRSGRWEVWTMRPDGRGQRLLFAIGGPLDGQVRDAAPHESHGWVEERISWAPLP